eukprot:13305572-Alexandrium_andersonii.AAC.1
MAAHAGSRTPPKGVSRLVGGGEDAALRALACWSRHALRSKRPPFRMDRAGPSGPAGLRAG